MPSEPEVNPRHRLPAMRKTWENAMVARTKYGPRSRLLRKPMSTPMDTASAAPTTSAIQGETLHLVPRSAAEYAPRPKKTEWPSEI